MLTVKSSHRDCDVASSGDTTKATIGTGRSKAGVHQRDLALLRNIEPEAASPGGRSGTHACTCSTLPGARGLFMQPGRTRTYTYTFAIAAASLAGTVFTKRIRT